jgi:hypothetical protein
MSILYTLLVTGLTRIVPRKLRKTGKNPCNRQGVQNAVPAVVGGRKLQGAPHGEKPHDKL